MFSPPNPDINDTIMKTIFSPTRPIHHSSIQADLALLLEGIRNWVTGRRLLWLHRRRPHRHVLRSHSAILFDLDPILWTDSLQSCTGPLGWSSVDWPGSRSRHRKHTWIFLGTSVSAQHCCKSVELNWLCRIHQDRLFSPSLTWQIFERKRSYDIEGESSNLVKLENACITGVK